MPQLWYWNLKGKQSQHIEVSEALHTNPEDHQSSLKKIDYWRIFHLNSVLKILGNANRRRKRKKQGKKNLWKESEWWNEREQSKRAKRRQERSLVGRPATSDARQHSCALTRLVATLSVVCYSLKRADPCTHPRFESTSFVSNILASHFKISKNIN